jgi:hypothetical protein
MAPAWFKKQRNKQIDEDDIKWDDLDSEAKRLGLATQVADLMLKRRELRYGRWIRLFTSAAVVGGLFVYLHF